MNGIDPSGHAKAPNGATKGGGGNKTGGNGRLSQNNKTPTSTCTRQSPMKPPYTAPPTPPKPAPNYQKPTTYSSGAAKAAQSAKTASAPSSPAADFMLQTVSDPYLALREATGQWQAAPASVTQRVEAAKAYVRRTCDPNAERISGLTRSEAGWKIVDGTIRMFIGGAEIAAAVSVPSPLSVPTGIVGAGNIIYGFSDVFEGVSVLTGSGSINPGRDLLFDGDQKKWDTAGTVLDISGFVLTGTSLGWGNALSEGVTGAPEVFRSVLTQLGKMYLSASVGGVAGSYVEGAITSVAGEDWGRAAGLVTRFAAGLTVYGYLDALDQNWNFSGVYGIEGIDPSVQSAANAQQGVGYNSFNALKKAIGSPGSGNQWHHIVEQSQIGRSGFTPQQIQNTANIIAVDAPTHAKISAYYSSKPTFTNGVTIRDWLTGQSFQQQYDFGIATLKKFGIL